MSGADDLRTAIVQMILEGEERLGVPDRFMALLADPARRLAILDAMGLELFTGSVDELARLIAAGHIAVVRPRGGSDG